MERLRDVPACVGPVNDLAEALEDPQVRARGMVAEVDGRPVGPGRPLRFSGSFDLRFRRAPGLGEHTAEVLAAIGVTDDELKALRIQGVV